MLSQHSKARVSLILAALFYSIGGWLIKLVEWNSVAIAAARSIVALGFLYFIYGFPSLKLTRARVAYAVGFSALVLLFVLGNKLTLAANLIFLQYTATVVVAFLAHHFLKERIVKADYIAMALALTGIAVILSGTTSGSFWGDLCGVANALILAGLVIVLQSEKTNRPHECLMLGLLLSGVVFAPAMQAPFPSATGWLIIVVLGIVQQGLGNLCYVKAVPHLGAIEVILILILEPVFSTLWAWLFLAEVPSVATLIGAGLIIAAVVSRCFIPQEKNSSSKELGTASSS